MGKATHHETVTTWTCDCCGRQDISSESSNQESRKLPQGWICAMVFEGKQPKVEFRAPSSYLSSYEQGWHIEDQDGDCTPYVWCLNCRKNFKVKVVEPTPPGQRGGGWRRLFGW